MPRRSIKCDLKRSFRFWAFYRLSQVVDTRPSLYIFASQCTSLIHTKFIPLHLTFLDLGIHTTSLNNYWLAFDKIVQVELDSVCVKHCSHDVIFVDVIVVCWIHFILRSIGAIKFAEVEFYGCCMVIHKHYVCENITNYDKINHLS